VQALGRAGRRVKAILPVHVFGQAADMDALLAVAERHGLAVIEDACEAIGGAYKGRPLGTLGDAGTFAFYPNKQMTTGEGGVVVSPDAAARQHWIDVCTAEFHALRSGAPYDLLSDYAAKSPGEFFAVATEVFFTRPDALRTHKPDLYLVLSDFYRQDPAAW